MFRVRNFIGEPQFNSSEKRDSQVQDKTFEQVACGSEHCFALSTDGDLFSWGLNFKG